jgi:hypothetical protein
MSAVLPELKEPFVPRLKRWIAITMSIRNDKDRGPDPDAPLLGDEDIDRIVRLAIKYGGHRSYNNGDSGNSWTKWMVTLCGGLALMGIGGGIVMYGKLSAIEANQVSQQRQLDQLAGTVATLRRAP